MEPMKKYYETLANTIIKNLERRRIEACYCSTKEEALAAAMDLVADGSCVSFGGSMTIAEIGLLDALRAKEGIRLLDRYSVPPEELPQLMRESFFADTYFMSTNAITFDGELVNIDGSGNRVAAMIYGPSSVVNIAGMNKVSPDLPSAMARAKETAAAPNAIRLNRNTPCAETGHCGNCLGDDSICSHTVVTRRSAIPGRIKVILVGESLGY